MKERLRNPVFILAIASLVYQLLGQLNIQIEQSLFEQIVDVLCYGFIGFGVYSTFQSKPKEKPQEPPKELE
ncbi:hypothetical protein FZC84_21280 [Rossellomorea vietnamensis]|uniref:Uncharacterized protein n=1 Tax=Rossellomorea vietnamensis TaxID=218284 RepID=A0A5D4M2M6_9BACI|nr:hypothetical protein [Rossellomorea vietnamensis]TYR95727.1 hypothetical protein FZC84_21280 [Rossellomorea vietnamensis]